MKSAGGSKSQRADAGLRLSLDEGCRYACWLVSCLESYADPIDRRAPLAYRQMAAALSSSAGRDAAIENYVSKLLAEMRYIGKFDIGSTDILLCGRSDNNLKEFAFLQHLLIEAGCSYNITNILLDGRSRKRLLAPELAIEIADGVRVYLTSQPDIRPAHLTQIKEYVGYYAGFCMTLAEASDRMPRLAVVANDHVPAMVAFHSASQNAGVPTAYFQHASVSDYFPPLKFDFAVLRDEMSRDIYASMPSSRGRVFVASRRLESNTGAVGLSLPDPIVGLYPTAGCDMGMLRQAYLALQGNTRVSSCFIKPHPAGYKDFSNEDMKHFDIRQEVPGERHIAIVGNSSVAIELMTAGNPAFNLFCLDEIERDYYGFYAAKLIPEVQLEQLSAEFWAIDFFNDHWLAIASRFDPHLSEDQSQVRSEIVTALSESIETRSAPGPMTSFCRAKRFLDQWRFWS